MKKECMTIFTVICLLAGIVGAVFAAPRSEYFQLIPARVEELIVLMEKVILPPHGIEKEEVDRVFGEPKEIDLKDTFRPNTKSSTSRYTHVYELLESKQDEVFRTRLYVQYREEKAQFIRMNHACVAKGRKLPPDKSELKKEKLGVLVNLLEIQKKFNAQLRKAEWEK